MAPGPFGHEHMADRAQALLWSHGAYNRLPRHVRSLDVGAIGRGEGLVSLGDAEEFFVVTEFAEGRGYNEDLTRLRDTGALSDLDQARADALCDYLAGIHGLRGPDPGLYVRRIRDLAGHGECVMGLSDSYPERHGFITSALLEEIEHRVVAWRWRLRGRVHRLRQVHGDFHPWNLLFREGTDFVALDRSRGEWGEPADDLTCLTLNYLFFSLQRSGRLDGGFETLFRRFWDRYLERTGDAEILEVAAPFFAFRGLVMASPVWYPRLDESVRRKIFAFMRGVLDAPRFEPERVNALLEG
jgi:aminoglycoside phosphotransferase (APT) family kinase protein